MLVRDFSIDDVVRDIKTLYCEATSGVRQQPSTRFLSLSFTNNQLSSLPSFFSVPSTNTHLWFFFFLFYPFLTKLHVNPLFLIDVPWAAVRSWEVPGPEWRVSVCWDFCFVLLLLRSGRKPEQITSSVKAEEERGEIHNHVLSLMRSERPCRRESTPATIRLTRHWSALTGSNIVKFVKWASCHSLQSQSDVKMMFIQHWKQKHSYSVFPPC